MRRTPNDRRTYRTRSCGYDPRNLWTPQYGLTKFRDLFTNRQLVALTTFSDLVAEARERVVKDAIAAGQLPGTRLEAGGTDAEAYADAVATYLGMALSRTLKKSTAICSWDSSPKMEAIRESVREAGDSHGVGLRGGKSIRHLFRQLRR